MSSTQKNARQFYYDVLAPEEQGSTYAQVHHKWLFDNPAVLEKYHQAKVFEQFGQRELQDLIKLESSFKPTLSNDFLLNTIVDELSTNTSGPVQAYLKNVFVAKRNVPLENAAALESLGSYQGDLIFFYVGLSLACHEYANLFVKFIHYELADSDDNKKKERLKSELIQEAQKLYAAQTTWKAEGDYVRLRLATMVADDPAGVIVAYMTDRFILCHEIAHHLLGHTGRSDIGSHYLEGLPIYTKKWLGRSKEHQQEMQADALAVILSSGYLQPRNQHPEDQIADGALGSLLTLTVLGQAAGMTNGSVTHPSVKDRLLQCASIIESLDNNKQAINVAFRMIEFHHLLEYVESSPPSPKVYQRRSSDSIFKRTLGRFFRAKQR
jgi:hypothetical protein